MTATLAQALAFAQAEHDHRSQDWRGYCQKFARSAWEVDAYYGDATSAWFGAVYRHGPDVEPPPGALIFWTGGAAGHGHVAVSTGGWNCYSTDILRSGQVDHVKVALIDAAWPNVHRVGHTEDINRVRVINSEGHTGEGGGTPLDPPAPPEEDEDGMRYIKIVGLPADPNKYGYTDDQWWVATDEEVGAFGGLREVNARQRDVIRSRVASVKAARAAAMTEVARKEAQDGSSRAFQAWLGGSSNAGFSAAQVAAFKAIGARGGVLGDLFTQP